MKYARVLASIGAVGFFLLLAGCSSESKSIPAQATASPSTTDSASAVSTPLEPIPVRIAIYTGSSSISSLLQAIIVGEKLDQKHGIAIKPYESPSASNLEQALVLGNVEVGFAAPLTIANLNAEKGKDIVFFSNFALNQISWAVKPDAPYSSVADLKGKKVCTYAPGTASFTSSKFMAAVLGLDLEKDFGIVAGEAAFCVAALEKGDVQAAALHEPLTTNLIAQGKVRSLVFISDEVYKRANILLPGNNNVAASRSWIEKNPEAARRLDRMYREAAGFILKNPGQVLERYGKEAGIDPAVSVELARQNFLKVFGAGVDISDIVKSYDRLIVRAVEIGLLAKAPDAPIAISLN